MFGKISDEELAAYLDGKLSKKKSAMVNAAIDINTLEILRVSEKAIGEFPAKKRVTSQSSRNLLFTAAHSCKKETLQKTFHHNPNDIKNKD